MGAIDADDRLTTTEYLLLAIAGLSTVVYGGVCVGQGDWSAAAALWFFGLVLLVWSVWQWAALRTEQALIEREAARAHRLRLETITEEDL
jgi:hypothetical protein